MALISSESEMRRRDLALNPLDPQNQLRQTGWEVPVLCNEAEDAEIRVVRAPLASLKDDQQHSDRGRGYWLGAYMHGVCQSGVFPKMAL